jgi:hypothetical protein
MMSIKHLSFALAGILCALVIAAQAQTPRLSTVNITTEADHVRIAAQGDVSEMRVDVADEQGDIIFQSGQITGQQLDWKMTDAQGERVKAGTYLVTVTFRTAAGKLRKRVEQVTVDEAQMSSTPTPSAPATTLPVQTTGTVTVGRVPKFYSIGANAVAITNSVITESAGKVGIGTLAPTTVLSVNSTASNSPAILAANNASGGIAIKGGSSNATGIGVWGIHTSTSGVTPGVKGETNSTAANAVGVLGLVSSTNAANNSAAVRGTNKSEGFGVWGEAAGDGIGVYGTSAGIGVEGISTTNSFGVVGHSTDGIGVHGFSTNSNGVVGTSDQGIGVHGFSTDASGVDGISTNSMGVNGTSTNSVGVMGKGSSHAGVQGTSDSSFGVEGISTSGVGVQGSSSQKDGVVGKSDSNSHAGVAGSNTGSGFGVYGESLGGGFAGYFAGDVRVIGTINPSSDRAAKADFQLVNSREVLRRVANLPILSWSYRSDRWGARHMGPTAQDFAASFGLGRDEKSIATVDADGVALAAIQGLYQMMREKDRQIEKLQSQVARLQRTVRKKRARQ